MKTDHRAYSVDSFSPCVGTEFNLQDVKGAGGEAVRDFGLRLESASLHQLNPADGRAVGKSGDVRTDPFSLIFSGPADRMLSQGIYVLAHDDFDEELALFLVPIGPGGGGLQYECTFG